MRVDGALAPAHRAAVDDVDGTTCTFFLAIGPEGSALVSLDIPPAGPAGDPLTYGMTSTIRAGTWTHVTMGVELQNGGPVAGVAFNGTTALAKPITAPKCDLKKPPTSVGLGIYCMRAEGRAGEIEIDNVVVRAAPAP
jgi:hypothetical protein